MLAASGITDTWPEAIRDLDGTAQAQLRKIGTGNVVTVGDVDPERWDDETRCNWRFVRHGANSLLGFGSTTGLSVTQNDSSETAAGDGGMTVPQLSADWVDEIK
jgi:hypothetical protein